LNELSALLAGHHLDYDELTAVLKDTDISSFFYNLDMKGFLSVLFE